MDLLSHLKEAKNWGGIIQQKSMDPLLKWVKTSEDVGMGWLYSACGIEVHLWQSERKLWATEKNLHPKDIFTSWSLNIWILPYMQKNEYYILCQKCDEVILDYPSGPKCLYKCPYKRVREESVTDTQERRQCDPKGRDWSDVATSQRMTTATRSWKRPRMDPIWEPQ